MQRATQLKAGWISQINSDMSFKVPSDALDAYIRGSVLNVFNSQAVLRISETGTTSAGTPGQA